MSYKKVPKYSPPKPKDREVVWRFSSIHAYEQFNKALKEYVKSQEIK